MSDRKVSVAIVLREGKILIAQRKPGASFANLWELPGGKCRPGEDPADCLVREVLEETGLAVRTQRPLFITRHSYDDFRVSLHVYLCTVDAGEARPLESQAVRWVLWEDLKHYRFPAATGAVFSRIDAEKIALHDTV